MDMPWTTLTVFAAGAAGSLLRVVAVPPSGRLLLAMHVGIGALMAVFVAPAIVEEWFAGHGPALQRGLAFTIGVLGPLVGEVAIHLVQRRGFGIADRFIERFSHRDR